VERFAHGVRLLQDTCPGLVQQIEAGDLTSFATRAILERALQPMLAQGIDRVVLGCTHYPFVIPLIQQIVGDSVQVIDPAPAVARQVSRVLNAHGWLAQGSAPAEYRFFTSGKQAQLKKLLPRLLGEAGQVQTLEWDGGNLRLRARETRQSRS